MFHIKITTVISSPAIPHHTQTEARQAKPPITVSLCSVRLSWLSVGKFSVRSAVMITAVIRTASCSFFIGGNAVGFVEFCP